MTLDVEQMPKRIWARITETDDGGQYGDWWDWVALGAISYVRADLFDAQAAEISVLNDEAAKLDARVLRLGDALRDCLSILDALIEESGREIEWGEEDPFRMGEWFEADDLARIKSARAALSAEGDQ